MKADKIKQALTDNNNIIRDMLTKYNQTKEKYLSWTGFIDVPILSKKMRSKHIIDLVAMGSAIIDMIDCQNRYLSKLIPACASLENSIGKDKVSVYNNAILDTIKDYDSIKLSINRDISPIIELVENKNGKKI